MCTEAKECMDIDGTYEGMLELRPMRLSENGADTDGAWLAEIHEQFSTVLRI